MAGRARRALLVLVVIAATALASTPAASSRTDDRAVDDATLDARELLASVPVAVRGSCTVADPRAEDLTVLGAHASSVVAIQQCTPNEDLYDVRYARIADVAALRGAFYQLFPNRDVPDEFGECPMYTEYESGRDVGGEVFCFTVGADVPQDSNLPPGDVVLTWTYEPESILVQVASADADAAWSFFLDDGGPLTERTNRGIATIPTHTTLRRGADQLFALLPRSARSSCIVVDDFRPDTLGSLYPWRLFIVADVEECMFPGDIEAEYVRFASRASMDSYYDAVRKDNEGPQVARYGTFRCPGSGKYDRGGGRWECHIANVDADAQATDEEWAIIHWTNGRHKVMGFGATPIENTRSLLAWFVDDAGPG